MGWLGAVPLIAVLLVTAIAAAAGGFWASGVARRQTSRVRGPFVVGVVCGMVAGAALTGGRRGLTALGSSTLKAVFGPLRAGVGLSGGVGAWALMTAASLIRRRPVSVDDLRKRSLATVKVRI